MFFMIAAPLLLLFAFVAPAHAQVPAFTQSGPLESNAGHVMMEWNAGSAVSLEIATSPAFEDAQELYQGRNHAYFLSGLDGGTYYLRLTDEAGEQSETIKLAVVHQSLEQAIWLTVIGAIIALGIVAVIVRGARA